MSVQFTQQPQQVIFVGDEDNQHLQSGQRVPLDRMTSRSDNKNPYAHVQGQLMQLDSSREERTERARVRVIFDKVSQFRESSTQDCH